jgi:fatty-acid desaturase
VPYRKRAAAGTLLDMTATPHVAPPTIDEILGSDERPPHERHAVAPPLSVPRRQGRIVWFYAVAVIGLHGLALLGALPWLFSWSGVILMIAGIYVFGGLGINLCYHRLLSHRSFTCPRWFEKVLVYIALCCMQDAPGRWVAAHRIHHCFADEEPDPHSPVISFLWSHIGWLLVDTHGLNRISNYERYARDLLRQPFYLNLERRFIPIWVYLGHAILFFIAGFVLGYLSAADEAARISGGAQLGLSWLVWGVFVRTVVVWHITWSVNSLTHMFGYRNYETGEESRNNWFVAVITSGEGWHNNHHHDPASASNQRKWWELDFIYWTILLFEKVGLARNVVRPKHQRQAVRPLK